MSGKEVQHNRCELSAATALREEHDMRGRDVKNRPNLFFERVGESLELLGSMRELSYADPSSLVVQEAYSSFFEYNCRKGGWPRCEIYDLRTLHGLKLITTQTEQLDWGGGSFRDSPLGDNGHRLVNTAHCKESEDSYLGL